MPTPATSIGGRGIAQLATTSIEPKFFELTADVSGFLFYKIAPPPPPRPPSGECRSLFFSTTGKKGAKAERRVYGKKVLDLLYSPQTSVLVVSAPVKSDKKTTERKFSTCYIPRNYRVSCLCPPSNWMKDDVLRGGS